MHSAPVAPSCYKHAVSSPGRAALPNIIPAGRLESPANSLTAEAVPAPVACDSIDAAPAAAGGSGPCAHETRVSPLTLSQTDMTRPFLAGRPAVPPLALGKLAASRQHQHQQPRVPSLPLDKVVRPSPFSSSAAPEEAGEEGAPSASAPAAQHLQQQAQAGAAAAATLPTSARAAIAAGFSRLLSPLLSARSKEGGSPSKRGRREVEWASQVSQASRRSWRRCQIDGA